MNIINELITSFVFKDTPQGEKYWKDVVSNLKIVLKREDSIFEIDDEWYVIMDNILFGPLSEKAATEMWHQYCDWLAAMDAN